MSYKRFLTIFTVVVLLSLPLARQALADTTGSTTRVSVSSSGGQGSDRSTDPSISADGRYVAFPSFNALVDDDTNGVQDIFLRDTQTNTTTRVSVASDGSQGNAQSYDPDISANGLYVVFVSDATNLVPDDTNGAPDVFLRDLQTNTTTRVSVASDGDQAMGSRFAFSYYPEISADGRYVTFMSEASNLVAGDTNESEDIFLRDLLQGTTVIVSVASDGTQADDSVYAPAVSDDGRYVVFSSMAGALVPGDTNQTDDVFLRDTQTNQTTRLSVAPDGTQGNETSSADDISGDGRYVVFGSFATNLVDGDTNEATDIFLRDLQTNTTTRISVGMDGAQENGASYSPVISADGRYVAFISDATNLVANDTNGQRDTFVYDTQTGVTTQVSVDSNGAQANDESRAPAISANGLYAAFVSAASNLVEDDTNGVDDTFLRRIDEPQPALLPATGFAPGRITILSPSTAETYSNLSMRLEIPTLKLNAAIVSVPKRGVSSWNVSGLAGNIGYLSGTASIAQKGNAVLTAHLYGANGRPGPFIHLERMALGQQIIIHTNGRQYVYVVISVKKWVNPSNMGILDNHESHAWLTLITCSGYNAKTNSYRWRTVVRATLVHVLDKP
ncbi:MAG: sortase [Anaerolineales bacterium]